MRVGPETKPSHQEAIPANTNASPASAGSFNPQTESGHRAIGITTGCAVTPGVPFPTVNCSGNPLPRSAEFSGKASYTHSFDLAEGDTVDASVATQFSSSKFLTIDFTAASKAAGYTNRPVTRLSLGFHF